MTPTGAMRAVVVACVSLCVPASTKPNVVMVLVDDLDARINGYGAAGVSNMAQLNARVASKGAIFERYFVAYPLCSPSRSTMLTGRYAHNTRFYGNLDLNRSLFHPLQEKATVNTWFFHKDYDTALIGKYLNGYHGEDDYATYVPPGWSSWTALQTVDYWGPRVNMDGVSVKFPDDQHQTDILANLSATWISQRHRPYFALITPHAPHDPQIPPTRYKDAPVARKMPADASFNERDALQATLPGMFAELPLQNETDMFSIYQDRARCLFAVDDLVGKVLDALDEDTTYFFFSSDNGYHLGHHRLPPGKREIFDHDARVPLVVSGPGVKPGLRTALVGNYDLAPTWADLCGVPVPRVAPLVDGRSFAPILLAGDDDDDDEKSRRSYVLQESWGSCEDSPHGTECTGRDQNSTVPSYVGLVDGRFTFATFADDAAMLFDDANDPDQTTNVAADHTDTVAAFRAVLRAVQACSGPSCP